MSCSINNLQKTFGDEWNTRLHEVHGCVWMILIKKHWINFVFYLTKFIHTPFVSTVTYSLAAWLKVCVRPESSSNDDTCEFTIFWASWRNVSHCLWMYLTCFGHCPRSLEQTARWQALTNDCVTISAGNDPHAAASKMALHEVHFVCGCSQFQTF